MYRTTIPMLALMTIVIATSAVQAQSSLLFNRPAQEIPSMQGRYDVRQRLPQQGYNARQRSPRQGRVYASYQPAFAPRYANRVQIPPQTGGQIPPQGGQGLGRAPANQAAQNGFMPQRHNQGPGLDNGQSMFAQPTPRGFSNNRNNYYPQAVLPSRQLNDTGYYVPNPPAVQIRKHDIVTVRVEIIAKTKAEGNSEMRRSSSYDLALTDWIVVNWFRWIKPSPQSQGDPRIAGTLNRQNRAEGDIDTSERLSFNIAAEVRDIYPNGNLLLGGSNFVRINNEVWKVSLSGACRPKDIGPNNTVLSENILNLNIKKEEQGQVRDAYKRGWFTRWFDRFHPF